MGRVYDARPGADAPILGESTGSKDFLADPPALPEFDLCVLPRRGQRAFCPLGFDPVHRTGATVPIVR